MCLSEDAADHGRFTGSTSESPPTSNSSPESPYHGVVINPAVRYELAAIWRCYVHLMNEIQAVTQTLGKDGKFQLFICLSLR